MILLFFEFLSCRTYQHLGKGVISSVYVFTPPETIKCFETWIMCYVVLTVLPNDRDSIKFSELQRNVNNLTWTVVTAAPWHFFPLLPLHSKWSVVCSSLLTYCLGIVSNNSPSRATCWDSRSAAVLKNIIRRWKKSLRKDFMISDKGFQLSLAFTEEQQDKSGSY